MLPQNRPGPELGAQCSEFDETWCCQRFVADPIGRRLYSVRREGRTLTRTSSHMFAVTSFTSHDPAEARSSAASLDVLEDVLVAVGTKGVVCSQRGHTPLRLWGQIGAHLGHVRK